MNERRSNKNNERYDKELRNIQPQEERLDKVDRRFYITIGYLPEIFQRAEKLFEIADVSEKISNCWFNTFEPPIRR